jgi:hypothetical protein
MMAQIPFSIPHDFVSVIIVVIAAAVRNPGGH